MRGYDSLRGRGEFALVMGRGHRAGGKNLSVFALKRAPRERRPKVGIVITKKVGNAVERNRLRRRCKAILDGCAAVTDRTWFVIMCRPSATSLRYAHLRDQLAAALQDSSRRAGQAAPPREARER